MVLYTHTTLNLFGDNWSLAFFGAVTSVAASFIFKESDRLFLMLRAVVSSDIDFLNNKAI